MVRIDAVEFFVAGEAKPAGSKVSGVVTRVDESGQRVPVKRPGGGFKTFTKDSSGPAGENWRSDVRTAAEKAMGGRPPFAGPLALAVTFYRARPKGDYGTGRNAGIVKLSAPRYPTTRPDATKLLRAVEDAMTGIVWLDDSQVVSIEVYKRWAGERVGARVEVWEPLVDSGTAALSSESMPDTEGAQLAL